MIDFENPDRMNDAKERPSYTNTADTVFIPTTRRLRSEIPSDEQGQPVLP